MCRETQSSLGTTAIPEDGGFGNSREFSGDTQTFVIDAV